MKKIFFLVPLLLAGLIVTGSTYRPGSVVDPLRVNGVQSPAWRTEIGLDDNYERPVYASDAVPRIMIRFDDARDDQYEDIKIAITKYGLPVALNANVSTIGTGTRMTVAEVNELFNLRGANGARLYSMQHWNENGQNMDAYPSGGSNSDIDDEYLRRTVFDAAAWQARGWPYPRVMVLPGDSGRGDWFLRNLDYVRRILEENGIYYAQVSPWGHDEGNPGDVSWFPNLTSPFSDLSNSNNTPLDELVKPGMSIDPYFIPTQTLDLGSKVVESPKASQWETALANAQIPRYPDVPIPIMNRATDGWTYEMMGRDVVDTSSAFISTFRQKLYSGLAGNFGQVIVLHEQDGSWESGAGSVDIPGGNFTEADETGSFHNATIFYVLAMLQKMGHIKVVGPVEFCEWVTSTWAPGTDLIANPTMAIPQVDIGDTIGTINEYFFVRGVSWYNMKRAVATNDGGELPFFVDTNNIAGATSGDGANEYVRNIAQVRNGLFQRFPKYGLTTGPAQHPNSGMWLYDGETGVAEDARFTFGNLPPGRYTFSLSLYLGEQGNAYQTKAFALGLVPYTNLVDQQSSTDAGLVAYGDSLFTLHNYSWTIGGGTNADVINWTGDYESFSQQWVLDNYFPAAVPDAESYPFSYARHWRLKPNYGFFRNLVKLDTGAVDSTHIANPMLIYKGQ